MFNEVMACNFKLCTSIFIRNESKFNSADINFNQNKKVSVAVVIKYESPAK
jgi:hypothetical protein